MKPYPRTAYPHDLTTMSSEETQNTAAGAAATPGQEAYEEEHVHSVYEQIASHFSSTRYKVGIVHDVSLFSDIPQIHNIPESRLQEKKRNKENIKITEPSPVASPSHYSFHSVSNNTNTKSRPNKLISFFFFPLRKALAHYRTLLAESRARLRWVGCRLREWKVLGCEPRCVHCGV